MDGNFGKDNSTPSLVGGLVSMAVANPVIGFAMFILLIMIGGLL
jgi:hypothetical protein